MTSTRILALIVALLAGMSAGTALADSVRKTDGTILSGSIRQLTTEGVVMNDDQRESWVNMISLAYDRPMLQAPGHRLIQRDGTAFCGFVGRLTRDDITFRSITAGELNIAWTNITAIRFGKPSPFPEGVKMAPGMLLMVMDDAERVEGSLVSATERNILLRTSDGMKKLPTDKIMWLLSSPTVIAAKDSVLILRNGDRLNGPVTWSQNSFGVTVQGRTLNMDQAAIRGIVCPVAATKSKE